MWRRQCPPCRAVFTGLPPFVWRDRQRRPEGARAAWLAIHGGLRVARGAVSGHRSPMALDRLVWACGPHRLVAVVPRWEQARPVYGRADEPHRRGLPAKVSLPPLVSGRVLGHLGDPEHARTAACPHSSQGFHRAAVQQPPTARVRGLLTDGVDRTTSRLRTLCPGARLGHCRRHALTTRPGTLAAIASPVRQA